MTGERVPVPVVEMTEDDYAPGPQVRCGGQSHEWFFAPQPSSRCECCAYRFREVTPQLVEELLQVGGGYERRKVWRF